MGNPGYILYSSPGTAGMAPHAALEEIGADFEIRLVDITKGQHYDEEYLALNPNARVPTLVDGDAVLFESAAILMYLSDKHPEAALAPDVGTIERGHYYQWLTFLTNSVQQTLMRYHQTYQFADEENAAANVKANAMRWLDGWWRKLDVALDPGPYLLGSTYYGCDLYLYMLTQWSLGTASAATDHDNLHRLIELVRERPAVQRMLTTEGMADGYLLTLPPKRVQDSPLV